MKRVHHVLALLAACSVMALGPPVCAAEQEAGPWRAFGSVRSPEMAAGLTIAAPMVLMVVASQSPEFLINFGVPVLGLSAGHMYAGDPVRGGLVMVASTLTGVGVFSLLNPSGGNGGGGAYVVALAASSVAIGIAAADAYFTTVERNQTRRGSSDAIDQEAP